MTTTRIAGFGAALWLVLASTAGADELAIHDFWVAETPPGARATAGFARITNAGAERVAILGAESSACERIEIHRTETTDGVARMIRLSELPVPAGGAVELAPGGTHLMLIGPASLHAGERVSFTFEIAGGAPITAEAEVRKRGTEPADDPHAHHAH